MEIKDLEKAVLDVWGKHTEYSAKGNRYVAFLIQTQVDEIVRDGFSDESLSKELADILLIIVRYFARRDISTEEAALKRLNSRHVGKQEQIKSKYLALYESFVFSAEVKKAGSEVAGFVS